MNTKSFLAALCVVLASAAWAQPAVTISINPASPGRVIPEDFTGLSFGTGNLLKKNGGYVFDATNHQMLTLFRELGIKNLRIGGTTVDSDMPRLEDIDALFRFAQAAEVRVIYSLRLANGNPEEDAAAAKYVWEHYRPYLVCFSIGNEPNYIEKRADPEITDYGTYLIKWKKFATAIAAVVPEAKFGGPDATTTARGITWGPNFARDLAGNRSVAGIFYHYYVGADANGKTGQQLIDAMLSRTWPEVNYPQRFEKTAAATGQYGFTYRFTEANSYCGQTVDGGNNAFATSLFALDFMYWWAAHGCPGVNFHCTMSKLNTTIYPDAEGNYQVYPIGYGIKAFNLGGHGRLVPAAVSNTNLDMTAYAVVRTNELWITVINKSHGDHAKDLDITVEVQTPLDQPGVMYLAAPHNDMAATQGVTLGGAAISSRNGWNGQWTPLKPSRAGHCSLRVPAASAAIVRARLSPFR